MINKILNIQSLILILLIYFYSLDSFSQEEWTLKKDKNDIKVFVLANAESQFKPYRALTKVKGSIQQFERILKDIENMTDWAQGVKTAKVLKESDTVQIFYSEAKVSFPFKNRDGIYQNSFHWANDRNSLRVEIKLLPEYLALNKDLVRIEGHGYWMIKILEDGFIEIFTEMHIKPGGNIPAWLANSFVDENPYQTMMNIQKLMAKEN